MEAHTVPVDDIERLKKIKEKKAKAKAEAKAAAAAKKKKEEEKAPKARLDQHDYDVLTRDVRDGAALLVAKRFNKRAAAAKSGKHVSRSLVCILKKHWLDHGSNKQIQPVGAKEMLLPDEKKEVIDLCVSYNKGAKALTPDDVMGFAEGVISKNKIRAKLLGNKIKISETWAREFLKKNDFRRRAATTDRTVGWDKIFPAGKEFFKRIQEFRQKHPNVHPLLCFNMDEFFFLLESNGKWTYTRFSGPRTPIAIRSDKAGFTCSVCTNAVGDIVLMQIIWQGKTLAVHVTDERHPKIMQQHRAESHFQNADTFKEWMRRIAVHCDKVREEHGPPASSRARQRRQVLDHVGHLRADVPGRHPR